MNLRNSLSVLAALAGMSAAAHAAGDAARGQALYQELCSACHAPDANGVGPAHRGVYGRAAAQAPGYTYSPALKAHKGAWNDETLDRWLTDPEKFVPGQGMGVSVPEARDRADLIAYLKTLTAAK